MAELTTWTITVARDYDGLAAVIYGTIASEEDWAAFNEAFPSSRFMVESYTRPYGIDWDGSKMAEDELSNALRIPYQQN